MAAKAELKTKFWKALKSDRTAMLGLVGVEDGHAQPMTALLDPERGEKGPVYFFTARDHGIVKAMKQSHRAMLHFASKDHELFAAVHGTLVPDNDRATVDRLWNPFIAAWFEGGKTIPSSSSSGSMPTARRSG
jgi:general stress protein 26